MDNPTITITNWDRFQHYKNRNPPWIKLHRSLLDNMEFVQLSDSARSTLVFLWILAAENLGVFQGDSKRLAFRLHLASNLLAQLEEDLKSLEQGGFIELASGVLAGCKQVAPESCSETEAETEAERETEAAKAEPAKPAPAPRKAKSKAKEKKPTHPALEWYCQEYERVFGIPYKPRFGQDGGTMKALEAAFGLDKLKAVITAWLEGGDKYWSGEGMPVAGLQQKAQGVLARLYGKKTAATGTAGAGSTPTAQPFHVDDVLLHGGTNGTPPHRLWDHYMIDCEGQYGYESGPWPRFEVWLAAREETTCN